MSEYRRITIRGCLLVFVAALISAWGAQAQDSAKNKAGAKDQDVVKQLGKELENKKDVLKRCIKEFVEDKGGSQATVTITAKVAPEGKIVGKPQLSVSSDAETVRLKTCIDMRLGSFNFPSFTSPNPLTASYTHTFKGVKKEKTVKTKKKVKKPGVYGVPTHGYGGEAKDDESQGSGK